MSDSDWDWAVSSVGPRKLLVWLEPWAEEFEVPARSTIALSFSGILLNGHPAEIESTTDRVVIWASVGQTVRVSIDDAPQQSASASIAVPGGFDGSTKELMNLLFGGQPIARIGGDRVDPLRTPWWQRAKRLLRW